MNFLPEPLFCDLETYSPIDLKTCGTHKYAEESEVMLFAYALGDGEIKVWDKTRHPEMPAELYYELHNPRRLTVWHNGGNFDRTIMKHALGFEISIKRVHDVMVRAMAHSLPGALDKLCGILAIPEDKQKDKKGKDLIKLFCKPRPKNHTLRRATRFTHPLEWQQFIDYAQMDIMAMREIYKKLPRWNYGNNPKEENLWYLDQKINNRGVTVDTDLAEASIKAVALAQKDLAEQTMEITNGDVQSTTQRDVLLKYILESHGVELPDMKADTLERRVQDPDLPWAVKELLAIRLQASTTSTSKYRRLIQTVSSDGRLRGLLQFCGATRTGRWGGRMFQPQNLPRPTHKQKEIDDGIRALKAGIAHLVFDDVMKITSSAIRGCIIAADRKKLVVSDLSNIEGRVAAWLAEEEWKLQAFRDYDKGVGYDLYALAYSRSMGITPQEVIENKEHGDGQMRQIGKVMELALGYQGGVGAFLTFAAAYGLDLEELTRKAWDSIPGNIKSEAERYFNAANSKKKDGTYGLPKDVFIVCDSLKRMWRTAHPNMSQYWDELNAAAVSAICNPGKIYTARKLRFVKEKSWLTMILPSGRRLCYPSAKVEDNQISYMGMNQYTRKWSRIKTYGGKLFENACQAIARDVMADNMPGIENTGYAILLTVHDEVITEAPDNDNFNIDELSSMLATNPEWAEGLPLAAAGFERKRYKKD